MKPSSHVLLPVLAFVFAVGCDNTTEPIAVGGYRLLTIDGQQGPVWDFPGTNCTSGRIKDVEISFGQDGHSVALQYNCDPGSTTEVQRGTYTSRGDSVVGGVTRGENLNNDPTSLRGRLSPDRQSLTMVFPEFGVAPAAEFRFAYCGACP